MLGWLRLFLLTPPLMSAFGLLRRSALGFSRSEIEIVIRLGVAVLQIFFHPSLVIRPSEVSPPQVWYIEVTQPERTREFPQLVQTKGLGEDVGSLPIGRSVL